ncbi:MAG: hypothetical protein QOK42_1276 [Frankiaceae bacterium]|nr:hypothetical protein [Frankiaceae bacterium]
MGRSRTEGASSRPAALLPVLPVVLAAVGLAGCGHDSPSGTTITAVRDAVVVAADGSTSAATVGRKLQTGEALRTSASNLISSAILSTGGREAILGYDTLYYVRPDGAELRRGALIVDGRSGPHANLDVGPVKVDLGRGGVVRMERTAAVRVGVLAGSAQVSAIGGGHLSVPSYRQVLVVGRVLPRQAAPLVLTDDSAERRVVPDLVADDQSLQRTALALDSGPDAGALVAAATREGFVSPASFTGEPAVAPALAGQGGRASTTTSEVALPVAIGRAARGTDKAAVAQATRLAFTLRQQDGSWGVVARLVGTTSSGVSAAIDALLGSGLTGPSGPITGPTGGPVITLPGGPTHTPDPSTPGSPSEHPTTSPRPTKSPTPKPSSSGTVDDVKDVVGRLVPTPIPSLAQLPLIGGLLSP